MPCITDCPRCGKSYEEKSEEEASSPNRLCLSCYVDRCLGVLKDCLAALRSRAPQFALTAEAISAGIDVAFNGGKAQASSIALYRVNPFARNTATTIEIMLARQFEPGQDAKAITELLVAHGYVQECDLRRVEHILGLARPADAALREEEGAVRRIYVASSWKNAIQPPVVAELRRAGYKVYDFRHPLEDDNGFSWSEIDPNWQDWAPEEYLRALSHPAAIRGFGNDWRAMEWADTGILVLPCGKSAHIEAGYFIGAKKRLFVLMLGPDTPELMYKMATGICTSVTELLAALAASPDPKEE